MRRVWTFGVLFVTIGSCCWAQNPNLLANAGFEIRNATTGKPAGWSDNGFVLDATVARSGIASFRLTNANLIPYSQSATQTVVLKQGVYRIGGWVKMSSLAGTTGGGLRVCLLAPISFPYAVANACTPVIKGTSDWQFIQMAAINISKDTPALFSIQAYNEPDGTAWFDDLLLEPVTAVSVSLAPASITLWAGQTQSFAATVTGTSNSAVTWKVNGVVGGSPAAGTITGAGLYTAPASIVSPVSATVTAISIEDWSKSAAVSVTLQPPIAVTVSPVSANLLTGQVQQFTASVTNATNSGVTWTVNGIAGGTAAAGTISNAGVYTAPVTVPNPGTVAIAAVGVQDPGKSAAATVTIRSSVAVTVSPGIATSQASQTLQFLAAVTGSTNTAVVWSLTPSVGTISGAGLYLAPPSISVPQVVTVTATSAADSSKTASATVTLAPPSSSIQPGGLTSYPVPVIGPNLLVNSGFEQKDALTGKPLAWTDNGFSLDASVAHGGQASFRLTNANTIAYSQVASQTLQLKKGVYRIAGWVKLSGMAATVGGGVRLCLYAPTGYPYSVASGCTSPVKGTADWQALQLTTIAVSQDTQARFAIEAYGDPDGTAWFDDLELRQEQMPLDVFLLYPNYRGILFDDQSQIARFDLKTDLTGLAASGGAVVRAEIVDEAFPVIVFQQSLPAATSLSMSFDLSSLTTGRSYLANFRLVSAVAGSPDQILYTYPGYRIVKAAGFQRTNMSVSFDQENRFLIRGQPGFILGVYDSGLGYASTVDAWESLLTTNRRLFELPINFYLNYWYGGAPNSSMFPMMDALGKRGILTLTNANCFSGSPVSASGAPWFVESADSVIHDRGAYPGFGGFYAADECLASLAPDVFGQYRKMKALAPGSIVLGTLLPDAQLPLWRDTVDVLATDPYPFYGAEPVGGYPLSQVADGTRLTAQAVHGSRPFVTTIQFFQFTSKGRWPTQAELRSMSYAAIAEGANGLFYWSLGANALAYICDGSDAAHSPSGAASWCQAKVDNFTNLKTVMRELKGLEPMLTLPDRPGLLAANGNPAIRARVKYDGTTAYLIAYNASNVAQSATFQWSQGANSIAVPQEGRTLAWSGLGFTDSFVPNGVHVYVIR